MFLIQFPPHLFHSSTSHVKTSQIHNFMINLIPSMPILFIKFKHPSIFTYILFRKNNLDKTCNKSSKQSRKQWQHAPLHQSRSSQEPCSGEEACLAQAVGSRLGETATVAPGRFHELLLGWGLLAWARQGVAQNVNWSPEQALEAESWASLCYSPRRDELAWARIPVLPHCSTHATQKQSNQTSYFWSHTSTNIFKSF